MTLPVTVVIPVHNGAGEIDACLRSVFAQSQLPDHVIVVNDASQDGTAERLAAWQRPDLTVLTRQTPGAGGYAARNLGVSLSDTPWIAFLDADDVWEPRHLEVLHEGVRAHPQISFAATGRMDVTAGPGSAGVPDLLTLKADGQAELLSLSRYLDHAARGLEPFLTSCVMMTRALFDAAGGFPEQGFRRGGDADLWLRAMALTETALRIHQPTCQYWKKRPGSVTAARANARGPHPIHTTVDRIAAEVGDLETRQKLETFAQEKQLRWLRETGGWHGRLAVLRSVSFWALTARGKVKYLAFLTGASSLSAVLKALETKLLARRREPAGQRERGRTDQPR